MANTRRSWLIACATIAAFGLASAAFAADAPPKHVRGTLTAVTPTELSLETAGGKTQAIKTTDDTKYFLVTPATAAAITANKFVGITSVEEGGKRVAKEVHVFDENLRGLAEGHYPWDLESGPNMMTNANIGKVETVGGDQVLKLDYKGGTQTIAVPASATVVAFSASTKDQAEKGRKVFVVAKAADDGGLTALFVVVGAPGVKPPM